MEALDDIIHKHNEDDIIVCVTSGTNLSPFVYYFTGIKASEENTLIQAITCSPVLFSTNNEIF